MRRRYDALNLPPRLLLGAGPSNPDPRVLQALATPPIGPRDPAFALLLDDVMELTRFVFRTTYLRSFPILGTARIGLEAVLSSLVEEGDRVVVGVAGAGGARLAALARRHGAVVDTIDVPWGEAIAAEAVVARLRERRTKLVVLVHVEPATGVVQPLDDIARACREADALLLLDAAASLGGCEVSVDGWGVDVAVGGPARCLAGPVGLAPLTYDTRFESALAARPPSIGALELAALQDFWSPDHLAVHATPTNLLYALREALRVVHEEGLERRWKRHRRVGEALAAGLEALGLRLLAPPGQRAPHLAVVTVPASVQEARVRHQLVADFGIEIGAGVGDLYGRTWRIGLMGYNARLEHALTLLAGLEHTLAAHGYPVLPHVGVEAARAEYNRAGVEGWM